SGVWDLGTSVGRGLAELAEAISGDVVFANLECSTEVGGRHIAKQPRILARPETIRTALGALRVNVVTLANNHVFDGEIDGFRAVRKLLDESRIGYFGAGESLDEAARPYILEVAGIRIGFLGFVAASTQPSHVATPTGPGVNTLAGPRDEDRARDAVIALQKSVDHVVVSLHWGVEYCPLPAPDQIVFARSLVDAGAAIIIGHHAHVIQGTERYGSGLIAYGLGNATTTDHYIDGRRAVRQSARTSSSCALRVTLDASGLAGFDLVPLRCVGARVKVNDERARRYLEAANRSLARGVSPARWRRVRFYEDVVLRTLRKLHPSVIRSVRPRHVGKFFENVVRAAAGRGPAP
ncbi:MAG: CapA family protein, partial [Candidatus Dadabacteria bacterium]